MSNNKIYGIDLGTTNSLIGYKDHLITGLVPSIANIQNGDAGEKYLKNFGDEISRSYKVDISLGPEGKESVLASSLVLKELCNQVEDETGERPERVVISVPAEFKTNQREATKKAAEEIGLKVEALVSEPTAAALKYNADEQCVTFVFDLGGGTLDCSVVDSTFTPTIIRKFKGLILGGDDFDRALRNWFISKAEILMHRLSDSEFEELKYKCSEYKIQMQKEGKTIIAEFSYLGAYAIKHQVEFTEDDYISIMKQVFKPGIDIALSIRNDAIYEGEDYKVIAVGGSTHCPYLRKWLAEELEHRVEPQTYDPDRIVAEGATYYAHLIEQGILEDNVVETVKSIRIGLADKTTRVLIPEGTSLPFEDEFLLENAGDCEKVCYEFYQGDNYLVDPKNLIGKFIYDYGEFTKAGEGLLFTKLRMDISGLLTVSVRTLLGQEQIVELTV